MPISHPSYYASYLARKIGPFATLGLAEDTWALNERVTDEATFLQQAHDIDTERQAMFFTSLDKLRRGCLVCVFDATDRIQHMFWRHLDPGHPASRGREASPHHDAIEAIYTQRCLGTCPHRLQPGDLDGDFRIMVSRRSARRQFERLVAGQQLPPSARRHRRQPR
jgi:hypothetical protein